MRLPSRVTISNKVTTGTKIITPRPIIPDLAGSKCIEFINLTMSERKNKYKLKVINNHIKKPVKLPLSKKESFLDKGSLTGFLILLFTILSLYLFFR